MTALDRAFIKAYSHKWRPSGDSALHERAPVLSAATRPAPPSQRAFDELAEMLPSSTTLKPEGFIIQDRADAPTSSLQAAALSGRSIYRLDMPQEFGVSADLAAAAPESRGAGIRGAVPLASLSIAAEIAETFRATLEVDAFQWPETCGQLYSRIAAELKPLASAMLERAATGQKLVVLTGVRRQEGRTTVALLLARALVEQSKCVALVDADFLMPSLAGQLGVAVEAGWESVLRGDTSLPEVMIKSVAEQLTLVPLSISATAAANQASRLRTSVTMGMLRDNFDLVLLDAGPLGPHGELGAPLGSLDSIGADCVYWIYDRRLTSLEQVTENVRQIAAAGIAVGGILENFGGKTGRARALWRKRSRRTGEAKEV